MLQKAHSRQQPRLVRTLGNRLVEVGMEGRTFWPGQFVELVRVANGRIGYGPAQIVRDSIGPVPVQGDRDSPRGGT